MGLNRSLSLESSVVALALGADDPRREECRLILASTAHGVELHACVELVQEVLFHRMSRSSRRRATQQAGWLVDGLILHELSVDVLRLSIELTATTQVGGRDAVHAASALHAGFSEIVSADRDFDGVPGLTRLRPAEALKTLTR